MKKFAKVLVLVLVVAFAMAMLVSCGTPKREDLEKTFKDKGYVVGSGESAEGSEYSLLATNLANFVVVIAFKDSDSLKAFTDTETYKTYKAKADKSDDYVIKTVGNAFVAGTKAAADLVK